MNLLTRQRTGFKGTAGEWQAVRGDDAEPERWFILAGDDSKGWEVATIGNGAPGDTLETEGHNAYLLAASPQALELASEIVTALNQRDGRQMSDVTRREMEPIRLLAEAFLKKALGTNGRE